MATGHVLVLGGTGEARRLADLLAGAGVSVTTSFAGATTAPARPAGEVRSGGFGGADGLADWLRRERPACVVDATHPFAARMSGHAAAACAMVGTPLLRLARPGWSEHPDAASWTWVDTHEQAARAVVAGEDAAALRARAARAAAPHVEVTRAGSPDDEAASVESPRDETARHPATSEPSSGDRMAVLLTVGRQPTPRYVPALAAHRVVVRVAEARDLEVPGGWLLLSDVGPFTRESEDRLFARHRVGTLVTKDSGGAATSAKLDAARQTGARVIVVRRPPPPPGVASVPDAEAAARWVHAARMPSHNRASAP